MLSPIYPLSRKENIVEQELPNEVLIYDLKENKALCLNETSALVWQLCDGQKSTAEISRIMSEKLKSPVTEDFVWLALERLKKENLLANGESIESNFAGLSRRQVIKKVGFASMIALPLISAIIAPTAANAQSGCIAVGGTTTGTFPFGGGQDSNTCLNTLRARCCSGAAAAGSSCNCIGNQLPDTCVGNVTCA